MKPPTVFGLREQGAMLLAVDRLGQAADECLEGPFVAASRVTILPEADDRRQPVEARS